ncbi:DUF6069 family protein [Cohnella zeiphila]|uniref:Uncharacterized protein n=1 Tax=Cohnella zeiphila TaxID=2761120 RepID=A0A7X0SVF3_9BACL|nr:DUF6069 family protein [Cohnella zeiphila]MBB6734598.1 hypothetical protein [Cohnella zeiphila]
MKKIWLTGLYVGVLSGVAGIAMFYLMIAITGFRFEQLNPVSILAVSVLVNLAGAWLYALLRRKTSRPGLIYAAIAIAIATLLSLMDWAYPQEPQIGDVAGPVHSVVVTVSIVLIPLRLRRMRR